MRLWNVPRVAVAVAVLGAALAAASLGSARNAARAVDTSGIVNITTGLAYENGYAAGTGMVITSSGLVLTNNHVIRGATTVRVTFPSNGRSYSASVLGYSVSGDIALVQLKNASSLTRVRLGNSAQVRVGQAVTAVGNAGGQGTLTSSNGTVVALNRTITVSDERQATARLSHLIQIDAPLEPGDSGGPTLDTSARVIGMDTAASAGFRFESSNEGYAIPINRAMAIVRQIRAGKSSATVHVGSTPLLGVSVAPASSGSGSDTGAYVVSVATGSPADRAGISAGSTIVRVDGTTVRSYDQLATILLRHHGGDSVTVTWIDSYGRSHTARIKTASGPPQ
jgi:S1-C subfamily serine protease